MATVGVVAAMTSTAPSSAATVAEEASAYPSPECYLYEVEFVWCVGTTKYSEIRWVHAGCWENFLVGLSQECAGAHSVRWVALDIRSSCGDSELPGGDGVWARHLGDPERLDCEEAELDCDCFDEIQAVAYPCGLKSGPLCD